MLECIILMYAIRVTLCVYPFFLIVLYWFVNNICPMYLVYGDSMHGTHMNTIGKIYEWIFGLPFVQPSTK